MRTLNRRQVIRGGAVLTAGLLVGCRREAQPPPGAPRDVEAAPTSTAPADEGSPLIQTREPAGSGDFTTDDLRSLLDSRAQAVMAGDEDAYIAPLDQGNTDLVELERAVFGNLRQLEFANVDYVTTRVYSPSPDEQGVYDFSPVIQLMQLAADDAPGGVAPAESFQYKVADRDGEPVITDIVRITRELGEEFRVDPGTYANAPWYVTELNVIQAGNVWLLGDDSVPDLQDFATPAEAEARAVETLWGDRTTFPGHVLFFSRNPDNLLAWYDLGASGLSDTDLIGGWQLPVQGVRDNGQIYSGQYAGSRIVVNLASTERWEEDPRFVIRHELVHAITSRAMVVQTDWSYGAPRWAGEGFARWVEIMDAPDRQDIQRAVVAQGVNAGQFTGAPPGDVDFYTGDPNFNYFLGATVFDFIEQARDTDAAVEFYARVIQYEADRLIYPDSGPQGLPLPSFDLDRICEEVLGTDGRGFLEQWGAFVRGGA